MANTLRCSECKYFDPVTPPKGHTASHGWCVARSLYPFKEGPGQVFPPSARRVDSPEKLAKPVIVRTDEVVAACPQALKR
jgi:hypothetical protein